MAGRQAARQPTSLLALQTWYNDARNAVDQTRRAAEAKGREIVEKAIRTGAPIVAKTTAELRQIGAKALDLERKTVRVAGQAGNAIAHPNSPEAKRFIRETRNNAGAAVRGAGDSFTLGLADTGSAAIRAALESGGDFERFKEGYGRNIEQERAQDQYDTENYGAARGAGQIAGVVAQAAIPTGVLLAIGGRAVAPLLRVGAAAVPNAVRTGEALAPVLRVVQPYAARAGQALAPAAKYVDDTAARLGRLVDGPARKVATRSGGTVKATAANGGEILSTLGSGAVMGAASQGAGDIASGQFSGLEDYLVAGGSGAVETLLGRRLGPGVTSAFGGGATSVGQDIVNGRDVSLENAIGASATGAMLGHAGGRSGERWVGGLTAAQKGRLGEDMSRVRTVLRGEQNTPNLGRYHLQGGGYTVPDGYIAIDGQPGLFESKFNSGRLSRRQEQAMQQLGDRYRLDSFLSRDIAALTGIPLGNLAQHLTLARLQDEER